MKREVDWRCFGLAPAHTSQDAIAAAIKCSFKGLLKPLYSPDLASSGFCLFPKLKTNICGMNLEAMKAS